MPTAANTPKVRTKCGKAAGVVGTALSATVAVGVAILFLALTGANRTASAPRQQSSGSAPLIYYRGTRAPSSATGIQTSPGQARDDFKKGQERCRRRGRAC